MKFQKRGQAALEFLTTYGWAILVVMVAIGALAYFGVLNPSKSLPERCVFGNGLVCTDWQIKTVGGTTGHAYATLQNGLGITLNTVSAVMTDPVGTCTITAGDWSSDTTKSLDCTKTAAGGFTTGDKVKVKITLTFKKVAGGYDQLSLGEIYATAQ